MRLKPPNINLAQRIVDIARLADVSLSTAYKWKCEASVPMRRGPVPLEKWDSVSQSDWEKGTGHVAKMVGVSTASAWNYGRKHGLLAHRRPGGSHSSRATDCGLSKGRASR